MKIVKLLIIISVLVNVAGCGNYGYNVGRGVVEFSFWDGSKKVIYTLEGADPKTFRVLFDGFIGADKYNVYRHQHVIAGADAQTFKVINRWHAVDKNHGYHDGHLIPKSESKTFCSLNSTFSKDNRDVYIATSAIGACHSETFNLLVNFWAKDKDCAYSGFNKIEHADIDTFEGLNRFYAKDRNKVYISLYRKIDEEKRKTLSRAERARLDEGNTGSLLLVYIVEGAESETFEVLSESPIYGKDKNRCFKYEKPIDCSEIP